MRAWKLALLGLRLQTDPVTAVLYVQACEVQRRWLLYCPDSSTAGSMELWAPTWKAVMDVNVSPKLIGEICRSLSAEN